MRSASIFSLSCILMFFIMNSVKDVEAGLTPMDNKCVRQKDIFVGGCGRDGNEMCINDFVQKGNDWPSSCEGEENRPSSCDCDNYTDQHLCTCDFDC
ncbi:putative defensin-like protein 235 [Raphanus sativus]|uniref:Defensin-like protein 235 n=1 Tax=Raphanus sativus TaxID=3726 RepID=A0A9W3D3V8_RAPSA|nr:putative defensin-like protein 235 [Raphanus sativus]